MTWGRMDDKFHRNRKVRALLRIRGGRAALGTWTFWWSWCLDDPDLDGFIPREELAKSELKDAEKLVEVELWDRVEGGFVFHDFHNYNPTREQVEAKKRADRNRVSAKRQEKSADVARDTQATSKRVDSESHPPRASHSHSHTQPINVNRLSKDLRPEGAREPERERREESTGLNPDLSDVPPEFRAEQKRILRARERVESEGLAGELRRAWDQWQRRKCEKPDAQEPYFGALCSVAGACAKIAQCNGVTARDVFETALERWWNDNRDHLAANGAPWPWFYDGHVEWLNSAEAHLPSKGAGGLVGLVGRSM